eukprot:3507056-Ditylum_brightwellii.AAC.1
MLARLGYVSTFSQAVAFGPKCYKGMGILTLKGMILEEKVALLLRHLRSSSSIGKQLKIMLDWAKHSAGTSMLLLEDPCKLLHLEGSWVPHLWKKRIKIKAHIK